MKKVFFCLILALIIVNICIVAEADSTEPLFTIIAEEKFIIDSDTVTENSDLNGEHSPLRQLPFLERIGDTLFATWSQHTDEVISGTYDAIMVSKDGGNTWQDKQTIKDFYATSIVELEDNTLLGMNYSTRYVDEYTIKVLFRTSNDGGTTWVEGDGLIHFDNPVVYSNGEGNWGSFVMHRTMMLMDDGSLQGVIYGRYPGDTYYRVLWVKSTDNGENFYVVSEIASGMPVGDDGTEYTDVEGFCEPVAARCADGSILCVMRISSFKPVFYSRSYDDGLTWSKPKYLAGVENVGATQSVDPDLELMSDGTLVVTFGRHDVKLMVSLDGCGYDWQEPAEWLYAYTGYSGIREVDDGKLLMITDAGNESHTTEPKIYGTFITLTRRTSDVPTLDRIELHTKNGKAEIGDNAQKIIVRGFDNDGRLMNVDTSELIFTVSDTNVLKISEDGTIIPVGEGSATVSASLGNIISSSTCIGVIDPNVFEVSVSVDLEKPLLINDTVQTRLTYRDRFGNEISLTSPSITYESSNTAVITVDNSGLITAVAPGKAEIEAIVSANGYTNSAKIIVNVSDSNVYEYSFEDDNVGDVPLGMKTDHGQYISVSDAAFKTGTKALRFNDNSASVRPILWMLDTKTSPTRYIEFNLYPVNLNDGFIVRFYNTNNLWDWAYKYNVTFGADGSVSWYNGSASNPLLPAGTVEFDTWNSIRISTDTSDMSLAVSVNGTEASVKNAGSSSETITYTTCISFDSGSTAGTECEVYIDDVRIFREDEYKRDIVCGDVNFDGKVDPVDVLIFLRSLARWTGYDVDDLDASTADVNGDMKINLIDALIISRHLASWTGYEILPLTKK